MIATNNLADLPRAYYQTILADPAWRYVTWDKRTAIKRRNGKGTNVSAAVHYNTMRTVDICAMPVADLVAPNAALFLWVPWPNLLDGLCVMESWGFVYKTCAFDWMKAHIGQLDLFRSDIDPLMGLGHWTRSNSEACLLGTRGKPKRLHKDVRMGIIEPRREHSRKPQCVHARIERLVSGPRLELFSRQVRNGWDSWGDQLDRFAPAQAAE